jgi:hypothetical protein
VAGERDAFHPNPVLRAFQAPQTRPELEPPDPEIEMPPGRLDLLRGPRPASLSGRWLRWFAGRTRASNVASGWGTPRRETARPGPSPAGEWMICRMEEIARSNGITILANLNRSDTGWLNQR